MGTLNLDKIFNPESIALIGASDREGSVGYFLMKNLTEAGYRGRVYPVNLRKTEVLGFKAYPAVDQLPETVDLAIIAIPAEGVPDMVEQCGKNGIIGIIIISAGFKETGEEGRALEERITDIRKRYNLRILGPNCLGIIRPDINLNATFTDEMPKPGSIAFISQSGALGTAILDWAAHENIGFSNFVSVGSMIDVDFGDLIDYFGTDPMTRSILMYIEGVTSAREFMSASRHFARTKPIIVMKSGRFGESAKAAASHTGSIAGEDMVYDAVFKRAGIIRVNEIGDLFNAAEVLGMQPLPSSPSLAIITNAGGPGVMAADALIARGGVLAKLSQETMETLNGALPSYWSRGNPIDVLGDADADRYRSVLEACLKDENIDGILIIYTPQGAADPVDIAKGIVEMSGRGGTRRRTLLTSFIGYEKVEGANRVLSDNSIPTYLTPEEAIATYMHMYQYKRNLELLYETPEELPVDSAPPRRPLDVIMKNAAGEGREALTETEGKKILEYYNIPVAKTIEARTANEAAITASKMGYPVVLKIHSPQIVHKTDVGGVILDIQSETKLREAFDEITRRAREHDPDADIQGVTVQPMIKGGYEVILGAKRDPLFGPVILFGMGGVGVEIFKDVAVGLPPLNQTLARRIMEETKVYRLLQGYRNMPPANLKLLEEIMVRFSQILVDFPQLNEVDINPLFIDGKKALALDARFIIDRERVNRKFEPHEHLVISPYPKKYETHWMLRDGRTVLLRPIKPEDELLWLEMFRNFSNESIRYRFFRAIRDTPHEMRVRYCNIDYDRELAIIAELTEDGERKIMGVVRVPIEPDGKTGEFAFIIADPWQGLGLGSKLVDYMIEICTSKGLETLYGVILRDNTRAISLVKAMGFKIEHVDDETVRATLTLKEEKKKWRISELPL
ncbi:MAG: bifunctional acetate--CoA ligase family protein/GNAT family N-acetyltransferase [Candidatus Bathyarchaeota archaeon]|nr:bifunctional acetate--CoA ligase family protein/GNAT family N-acetyltransferase [Candidatus Bathyarchaeota archaeon]